MSGLLFSSLVCLVAMMGYGLWVVCLLWFVESCRCGDVEVDCYDGCWINEWMEYFCCFVMKF